MVTPEELDEAFAVCAEAWSHPDEARRRGFTVMLTGKTKMVMEYGLGEE